MATSAYRVRNLYHADYALYHHRSALQISVDASFFAGRAPWPVRKCRVRAEASDNEHAKGKPTRNFTEMSARTGENRVMQIVVSPILLNAPARSRVWQFGAGHLLVIGSLAPSAALAVCSHCGSFLFAVADELTRMRPAARSGHPSVLLEPNVYEGRHRSVRPVGVHPELSPV